MLGVGEGEKLLIAQNRDSASNPAAAHDPDWHHCGYHYGQWLTLTWCMWSARVDSELCYCLWCDLPFGVRRRLPLSQSVPVESVAMISETCQTWYTVPIYLTIFQVIISDLLVTYIVGSAAEPTGTWQCYVSVSILWTASKTLRLSTDGNFNTNCTVTEMQVMQNCKVPTLAVTVVGPRSQQPSDQCRNTRGTYYSMASYRPSLWAAALTTAGYLHLMKCIKWTKPPDGGRGDLDYETD